jgi:hypothetical protein
MIHQWFKTSRFGILSFSSFLKGIFLAEKCSIMIHQWFETSWFGILSFYSFLKGIFLAENTIERN